MLAAALNYFLACATFHSAAPYDKNFNRRKMNSKRVSSGPCGSKKGGSSMISVFPLGRIVATLGSLAALDRANQSAMFFLARHARGDWGYLDRQDIAENEAVSLRLLSIARLCYPNSAARWLAFEGRWNAYRMGTLTGRPTGTRPFSENWRIMLRSTCLCRVALID